MSEHSRKHVLLDAAHEQRVRRLLGDESLQVAFPGRPLGFDDLGAGVRGGADVANLALVYQVGQRAEEFSTAWMIQRREPPRWLGSSWLIGMKNLVARNTPSRRPFSALPTISSDAPAE